MIKGSLKDASLPGLLQFLANEGNCSYRIRLERGNLHGDLMISGGHLIYAAYGLLRGEDALCELLTWDDGQFSIERLPKRLEATMDKNLKLKLQLGTTFADQASFLLEENVGLNTSVRPSKIFGTQEWQESSKLQPLQREDFLILGWLSEGRTMRQAMREFAFDLLQATSVLYRLVLTRSVEVVRALDAKELTAMREYDLSVQEDPPTVISQMSLATDNQESSNIHHTSLAPPSTATVKSTGMSDSSSRRTNVLPIISIDVERLMRATFTISQFGFLALKNPLLDEGIRYILLKIESGYSVEQVVFESARSASATLSTYRYCMERGYINNLDPVLPLTADLLLSRTEIDQYLLQRRRVTGEQLRDLAEAARSEELTLAEMLIRSGFLSQEDLDTVLAQQARFKMRSKPADGL